MPKVDKLMKQAYEDERRYFQQMKGMKALPCNEEPLYKVVARDGAVPNAHVRRSQSVKNKKKTKKQDGGFVNFLPTIIATLGPYVLDYAIKKFTGDGITYKKQIGNNKYTDPSISEKKHILYNILTDHPHLIDDVFK